MSTSDENILKDDPDLLNLYEAEDDGDDDDGEKAHFFTRGAGRGRQSLRENGDGEESHVC